MRVGTLQPVYSGFRETFLPLNSRSCYRRALFTKEANRKFQKLPPFAKLAEKHASVPFTIREV